MTTISMKEGTLPQILKDIKRVIKGYYEPLYVDRFLI